MSSFINYKAMQKFITIITLLGLSFTSQAQCPENIQGRQMQKDMFLYCKPIDDETKQYVSQVTDVNGTNFSCRFLHSNSVYQFTNFKRAPDGPGTRMQATVQSSIGGGYATGSVFRMNVLMPDPDACDLSGATTPYDIIATFLADNKSFLGRMLAENNGYTIKFIHTNSIYTLDKNFKVLTVQGGGYAVGSQLKVVHARILEF